MSDERRQAAEEWADRVRGNAFDREHGTHSLEWKEVRDAHLAGQECGEARAAVEIAALREVVRAYYDSLRYEGASDACLMIGINESVVRRALEEKP